LLYPLLDRWLARPFASVRRVAPTLLPVLLLAAAGSANFPDFRDALKNWRPLRRDATAYIQTLFVAQALPKWHLRICRPPHPYSKLGRMMTDQNEQTYFRIEKISNRCGQHR
jgi:hypothetical protein